MTAPWVDYLIEQDEAPIEEILKVVRGHGVQACLNALFDEGARCQYTNHDRMSACVRIIERIQQADREWAEQQERQRPRPAPREWLALRLKWRGPDRLASFKTIQADGTIARLDFERQAMKVIDLARQIKPNPAWRLVEYDFQGYPVVHLENETAEGS